MTEDQMIMMAIEESKKLAEEQKERENGINQAAAPAQNQEDNQPNKNQQQDAPPNQQFQGFALQQLLNFEDQNNYDSQNRMISSEKSQESIEQDSEMFQLPDPVIPNFKNTNNLAAIDQESS